MTNHARSKVHHSATTTTTAGAISAQGSRANLKAYLPPSTCTCGIVSCPIAHATHGTYGQRQAFSWQLDPTGEEAGEKGGGDHTGDAEPGTGAGLGRREEQAAWAPLCPVLFEPNALQLRGADAVNIACNPVDGSSRTAEQKGELSGNSSA